MIENQEPLGAEEAASLLTDTLSLPLDRETRQVERALLAVSGGPDSLSMLMLLGEQAATIAAAGIELVVATVDHGVRPEAAAEAGFVADVAAEYGLSHTVLRWCGWAGHGNFQAAAREARYDLLVGEAVRRGAQAIVTAHHEDDQIETHLLAAERGASGAALAGMRNLRALAPGVTLVRPFLGVSRQRIRRALERRNRRGVEDPSNRNIDFARVRIRNALSTLDGSERRRRLITIEAARDLRERQDAALLHAIWDDPADRLVFSDSLGRLLRLRERFGMLEPATARRYLARAVTAAGGAASPPSRPSVEALETALRDAGSRFDATLNGCEIRADGAWISFSREYGRRGLPEIPVDPDTRSWLFDRRMDVSRAALRPPGPMTLVALGALGRGNRWERTLPVLLDKNGEPVAAHEKIAHKLSLQAGGWLFASARVEWRCLADLRDLQGRLPAPLMAIEKLDGPGLRYRVVVPPPAGR